MVCVCGGGGGGGWKSIKKANYKDTEKFAFLLFLNIFIHLVIDFSPKYQSTAGR